MEILDKLGTEEAEEVERKEEHQQDEHKINHQMMWYGPLRRLIMVPNSSYFIYTVDLSQTSPVQSIVDWLRHLSESHLASKSSWKHIEAVW